MRESRETKTFFFYSQEWRRAIDYRTVASGTIATLAERQGIFTSPVCTWWGRRAYTMYAGECGRVFYFGNNP
jgi:hypothetical protein